MTHKVNDSIIIVGLVCRPALDLFIKAIDQPDVMDYTMVISYNTINNYQLLDYTSSIGFVAAVSKNIQEEREGKVVT